MRPEHPKITAARIERETAVIEHRTARVELLVSLLGFGTALVGAAGLVFAALVT